MTAETLLQKQLRDSCSFYFHGAAKFQDECYGCWRYQPDLAKRCSSCRAADALDALTRAQQDYQATGPYEAKALDLAADTLAALTPVEMDARAPKIIAIIRQGAEWCRRFTRDQQEAETRHEEAASTIAHRDLLLHDLAIELMEPEQMEALAANPALIVQAAKNVCQNEAFYRTKVEQAEQRIATLRQQLDRAKGALVRWHHEQTTRNEEIATLRQQLAEAIAHDRQPYPTAAAYERVCALLVERDAVIGRLSGQLTEAHERDAIRQTAYDMIAAERDRYAEQLAAASGDMQEQLGECRSATIDQVLQIAIGCPPDMYDRISALRPSSVLELGG